MKNVFDAADKNDDEKLTKEECVNFANLVQDKLDDEHEATEGVGGLFPRPESCREWTLDQVLDVRTIGTVQYIAGMTENAGEHIILTEATVSRMEEIAEIVTTPKILIDVNASHAHNIAIFTAFLAIIMC